MYLVYAKYAANCMVTRVFVSMPFIREVLWIEFRLIKMNID